MLSAHWSYIQLIAARLAPLGAGASQDLLARWPIQLGWIAERGGPAAASPELLQEMQLTIPAAVRWAQEPLPHAMPNFYWCASAPGMPWMRLSCRVCCLSPLLIFDKCFCLFSCCEQLGRDLGSALKIRLADCVLISATESTHLAAALASSGLLATLLAVPGSLGARLMEAHKEQVRRHVAGHWIMHMRGHLHMLRRGASKCAT